MVEGFDTGPGASLIGDTFGGNFLGKPNDGRVNCLVNSQPRRNTHGALEIIYRGEPIDLIYTDIVMPGGKTGVELAVEARDFLPNVKILLTSGYPGDALADRHSKIDEWPLIRKPFRQSEQSARLQDLLGR